MWRTCGRRAMPKFLEGHGRSTTKSKAKYVSGSTSNQTRLPFAHQVSTMAARDYIPNPLQHLQHSAKFWALKQFGVAGQRRTMFIQTESTPNPQSLMFFPGKQIMEAGSADFPNARTSLTSPLAKALFRIDGVTRVFFGSNFVTVTKADDLSWDVLKPEVFAAIMDFFASGEPLFIDSKSGTSSSTAIQEDDDEMVAMIKELIETRIRPAVQDDGGDIEYHSFDQDTGIVKLKMQGACSGCPSSSLTLKSGIENMLMHYIPEVKAVEQILDDEDEGTETVAEVRLE